ncbi:hypothetical protein [Gudongella oleilytica]|uniref:hypothetical protein n=1 Tax=Gudongella oleilytica TaxID=1582259 RepID=UPI000FF88A7F|nr:hypothetical protein [Gudongella oleilytica]
MLIPEFVMGISDYFDIPGKGIVLIGQISKGTVRIDDHIELMNEEGLFTGNATVIGIERMNEKLDYATENDAIGLVIKGVSKETCHLSKIVVRRNIENINETFAIILDIPY